jgi:hypothetical protein
MGNIYFMHLTVTILKCSYTAVAALQRHPRRSGSSTVGPSQPRPGTMHTFLRNIQ